SREVARTVKVSPRYLPLRLGRISTVAGSKPGSNSRTSAVRVWARSGCALPMTLMGKSLGYSMRDSSGGIYCMEEIDRGGMGRRHRKAAPCSLQRLDRLVVAGA